MRTGDRSAPTGAEVAWTVCWNCKLPMTATALWAAECAAMPMLSPTVRYYLAFRMGPMTAPLPSMIAAAATNTRP